MGENVDPSLLELVIEEAVRRGAKYAEARYHELVGDQFMMMGEKVITVGYTDLKGVGIRVLVDGGMGFASTNIISKDALLEALSTAINRAKEASKIMKNPITMDSARLGRAKYSVYEKLPLMEVHVADKIREIKELVSSVDTEKFEAEVKSLMVMYQELIEKKMIINSDGGYVEAYHPRAVLMYNVTASAMGESRNRFSEVAWTGGFERLKEQDFKGKLEDDIRSLSVALTRAKPTPKGVMDVVLSPELTGIAVHEAIGHPSEADRILGREAAQAGMSYWRDLKIGDRLGSDYVTIIDDPTIPGLFGFYLYDDEAVPARPRFLVRNGVITEMLQNRETGPVFGVLSNGAARARDFKSEPIVRMANTYFAPGDYTVDELIEDVKKGVYIVKYMEWNIDDYRWGARYVGLEAYLIENGRIGEPVKDPVLEITSPKFYGSVDAVGRDLQFFPGFCGKGEPMQGIPVTMGGPSIRLRGVAIR